MIYIIISPLHVWLSWSSLLESDNCGALWGSKFLICRAKDHPYLRLL